MKQCPKCKEQIEENEKYCSNCGTILQEQEKIKQKKKEKKDNFTLIVIASIISIYFLYIGLSNLLKGFWLGIPQLLIGFSSFPLIYKILYLKYPKKEKEIKTIQIFLPLLLFIILIITVIIDSNIGENGTNFNKEPEPSKETEPSKKTVIVDDFSIMSDLDREKWCHENNIDCVIENEYSDVIQKNDFISQSIKKDERIYEGDTIVIVKSLGKKPTIGQKNALKTAEIYSETLYMSKKRLYLQLTSEYGEGFTAEEAQYAIDHLEVDWKINALKTAKNYQEVMNMSKKRIYQQLVSEYGEGFTAEEAQYAIDHLED